MKKSKANSSLRSDVKKTLTVEASTHPKATITRAVLIMTVAEVVVQAEAAAAVAVVALLILIAEDIVHAPGLRSVVVVTLDAETIGLLRPIIIAVDHRGDPLHPIVVDVN